MINTDNMITIDIEDEAFAKTVFYAGIYKEDDKEYAFTICVDESEGGKKLQEITWCDEVPGADDVETMLITEKIQGVWTHM